MEILEARTPFRDWETWYRIAREPRADGIPLVCLHGGPGSTHHTLEPLQALADERPVVLYDQLGSGASSQPSGPSLWTIELFVDQLAVLREALGLERIHLLGSSWGGMLALEVALTRPPGLESLVLSSTLSSSRLWHEESLRLRAQLPPEIRDPLDEHERAGTTDSPEYREATLAFYHRHVCRLDPWPEVVEKLEERNRKEVYGTMWGPSEMYPTGTLRDWDVTPRLGEIRVPALVTCGRWDEATPRQARVIADGIAGAELVIFEQSAHLAALEEPERYAAVVRDFLARVERG